MAAQPTPEMLQRLEMVLIQQAKDNRVPQVKQLLQMGVPATAANRAGQTALHIAAMWGAVDTVHLLLEHGADPNQRNKRQIGGSTPLHCAASRDQREACRVLLLAGADSEARDAQGLFPVQMTRKEATRRVFDEALRNPAVRAAQSVARERWAARLAQCQRAERFKKADRVMICGEELIGEEGWVPAKVVERDVEDEDSPGLTLPYGVSVDAAAPCPAAGRAVFVDVDAPAVIRPELCFAAGMAAAAAPPAAAAGGSYAAGAARFAAGAAVCCRVDDAGDGSGAVRWAPGVVAAVGARGDAWPEGRRSAYSVQLDGDGGLVFAARDEHWLLRPRAQQEPGPSAPTAPDRFETRPDPGGRTGWARVDHNTGRSFPCRDPAADSDTDTDSSSG